MEALVHLTTVMPSSMPKREWDEILAAEHESATKLVESGTIKSIWRVPGGGWKNVGIWEAADATELQALIESLPMYPWLTAEVTPLARHPLTEPEGGS